MVHQEPSEGKKYKPRGRPFPKGNKRGKLENEVLATPGHASGVEGGIVAPPLNSSIVEPLIEESSVLNLLPTLVMNITDQILKENMESNQIEEVEPVKEEEAKKKEGEELVIVETVDFKNGENTLSLRFSRLHNRSFRIQIFLNNENEVRPVTYTGARTGYAFWNLLKGALRK